MKIKRTYKEPSLKAGRVEYISETQARQIFNQTVTYNTTALPYGEVRIDANASDQPIAFLTKGKIVETFFSKFELVPEVVTV